MHTIHSDFLTLVTRLILVNNTEVRKQLAKREYITSTTNEPRYILRVASEVYEMSFGHVI